MTAKVQKNGQTIEVQTEDLSFYYAHGWKPVEDEPMATKRSKKQTEPEVETEE